MSGDKPGWERESASRSRHGGRGQDNEEGGRSRGQLGLTGGPLWGCDPVVIPRVKRGTEGRARRRPLPYSGGMAEQRPSEKGMGSGNCNLQSSPNCGAFLAALL